MKRILLIGTLVGLGISMANAGIMSLPSIKHYPHENYYAGEITFDIISVYAYPNMEDVEVEETTWDEAALQSGFGGGVAAGRSTGR